MFVSRGSQEGSWSSMQFVSWAVVKREMRRGSRRMWRGMVRVSFMAFAGWDERR